MRMQSGLCIVLLLCVCLSVFISSVWSEGQCTAPPADSDSSSSLSSSSSTEGRKCSSCSCSQASDSPLPPFPELSSKSAHYGLLLSYDVESCKLKEQHTVMHFLDRARDYGKYLRTRFMSVDKDGDPRMMIFATEAERNLAIVDSNNLTEEQIKAYILGTAPPPPTPVYEFKLANVSLVEIESVLKYFNFPKGFPVRYYPDEAVQGDLLWRS